MDPTLLDALTILLSQALPHLLHAGSKAAEKVVEEVGKQAGAGAIERAKETWGKWRGKGEAKPAASQAAEDVACMLGNPDAIGALRLQLSKILAADDTLAGDLAKLLEAAGPKVSVLAVQANDDALVAIEGGTVARLIAIGAGAQGNVIILNAAAGPADPRELWRLGDEQRLPADLTHATTSYLKYLVERYRYLDFKGLGVSDRVPLRLPLLEMYVPLKARVETPRGETWDRLRLAGRQPTEAETEVLGPRVSEPKPILNLLNEHDGLIVLGDPGSGKSTFLKFLALVLATGQGESLGLWGRLPILLPLAAYANAIAEEEIWTSPDSVDTKLRVVPSSLS